MRERTPLLTAILLALAVSVTARAQETIEGLVYYYAGETTPKAEDLEGRRAAQLAQAKTALKVFYDFRFTDTLLTSGIKFRHQPTDAGLKDYAMVHYDHGNGLPIADVDGDDLYDVYLISQFGRNELWRNLGNGKFEDITDAAVALESEISVTGSFADVDNDGDADLFVTSVRTGNVLLENDGTGKFKDVTAAAGLGHVGHSSGAVFFDYDRDGLLDLFVTNVGVYTQNVRGRQGYYLGVTDAFAGHLKPERFERSILYRNEGGNRFKDVTEAVGLVDLGWTGDASPIDFNDDGFPDLYVPNMQGDDHYWENVGGERFVEKSTAFFPKTPWGSMGIKVFDFDNNGLMDIILTDMHSDMSADQQPSQEKMKSDIQWDDRMLQGGANNIFGNALFQQVEKGVFREVSDEMGAENYWPWGVSVEDVNADGWDDVFIAASMNYPYRYGVNSMLLNNRGEKLVDSEFLLGIEPRVHGYKMRPWFQLDCSGPERIHPVCQKADPDAKILVWGTLGTRTSAIFDLDDDGDLDIVTGEFNERPQVLISDLSTKRAIHYLKIRLVGSRSNRDGLGARVTVTAGDHRQTKFYDGKSGYLTQSRYPLYFGLGEATAVDRIEVRWPSGTVQTVDRVAEIDRLIQIEEPAAE